MAAFGYLWFLANTSKNITKRPKFSKITQNVQKTYKNVQKIYKNLPNIPICLKTSQNIKGSTGRKKINQVALGFDLWSCSFHASPGRRFFIEEKKNPNHVKLALEEQRASTVIQSFPQDLEVVLRSVSS